MLCPMAEEDIKYLQGLGVQLTPAQIVRLNDLALQVEAGPESSALTHAPRVAWACETPVYEPTIQAQVWMRDFGEVWWEGQSLTLALAWSCAHARERDGFFQRWTDERKTRKEIERWQGGLTCTLDQLLVAVNYAVNGVEKDGAMDVSGEGGTPDGCPYTDIIVDALACEFGCPVGELERMPRRIIIEAVRRWAKNKIALAGGNPNSISASGSTRAYCAYADYLKTLTPGEQP